MRPMRLSTHLSALFVLLAPVNLYAATFYVSPTGSDNAEGTEIAPFATLQKANNVASGGDTIYLRAGTYYNTSQITLTMSGSSDTNRTKIWAYPNEKPVLDCSKYVTTNKAADVPCILVTGSFMHLKGLEIANGPVGASGDHSISMLRTKKASNNTFELLNIHHGFGPGLFIDTGTGGNLILNCDSHDNYDKDGSQGDGQNGDGFGVHYQTTGTRTIIRGCRAWLNSDDGYDFISQEYPVTIENSWANQNGYANGGTTSPSSGNGNGFKIGSSQTGVRHLVQNNVAWKNKAAGFYANHSSGGNTWYNNTSYNNGTQYNMLASPAGDSATTITLSGALAHIMRNNVGFPNKNANMSGVDTAFNTWDLGLTEVAADFASTADTGCTGPREADGSMPTTCTFLKLKAGSPLIDKGKDVGLAFVGTAPDLGAYEYGASGGTTSTGGSTSTGGATSTGGSQSTGGTKATGGATYASGTSTGGTVATTTGGNGGTTSSLSEGGSAPHSGGATSYVSGATTGVIGNNGGSSSVATSRVPTAIGGNAASNTTTSGTVARDADTHDEADGCSCNVPAKHPSRLVFALFGLGLPVLLRRRRSR